MSYSFLIIVAFTVASVVGKLGSPLRYHYAENPQVSSIEQLLVRVLGNRSDEFDVIIKTSLTKEHALPSDNYHVGCIQNGPDNHIVVTASSAVAAAWTLNWYLKKYGKCHISWDERQLGSLAHPLPRVPDDGILLKSRYEQIFMGNPCVYSYTMAFWNFTEWEPFIDWLALNGFNLFLMPVGYESVLYTMYRAMGLNDSELSQYFVGPAYQAWFEMGNIRNLAGPLTPAYFNARLVLGRAILQRLTDLGIEAVLPAFNGLVPPQLSRVLPANTTLINMHWSNFGANQSQAFLSVINQTTLYSQLILNFLQHAATMYGSKLFANVRTFLIDSFNEMGVPINTVEFISNYSLVVSSTLRAFRPDAVWMMQGWMFVDGNWDALHTHALLDPVPRGSMIILDSYAENIPIYTYYENFFGHRFIWCMLHSFGGVNGWFGKLSSIVPGPQAALNRSELAGIGLDMEGFYHNYVLYELMLENAYPDSSTTVVSDWTDWLSRYAERRYGVVPFTDRQYFDLISGWNLAAQTVYTQEAGAGGGIIDQNADPYLNFMKNRPTWSFSSPLSHASRPTKQSVDPEPTYLSQLFTAWKLYLNVPDWLKNTSVYQHDLVDLSRQSLSALARNRFDTLRTEFHNMSADRYARVQKAGSVLLEVMNSFDPLLATHPAFLAGTWVEQAKRWNFLLNTTDQDEDDLAVYNAQSQLATWADSYCCLDYAGKQWNGLFTAYYVPRHNFFVQALLSAVLRGQMWSQTEANAYDQWVSEVIELPFGYNDFHFSTVPVGDAYELSRQLYNQFATSI